MAKGVSLHIGLNRVDPGHYAGWTGEFGACEADAASMQAIAKGVGYATRALLTDAATRARVSEAIRARIGAGSSVKMQRQLSPKGWKKEDCNVAKGHHA